MEIQTSLWEKPVLPADIVYTPLHVSKGIIKELNNQKEEIKGVANQMNNGLNASIQNN